MSFEASGLESSKPYEFWVTASTNIGEGQQSKSIIAIPSDKVPAKIASFDDTFTATFKEDAKLPCLAVGSPTPNITWKVSFTHSNFQDFHSHFYTPNNLILKLFDECFRSKALILYQMNVCVFWHKEHFSLRMLFDKMLAIILALLKTQLLKTQ